MGLFGTLSFVDGAKVTGEMLRRVVWMASRGDYGRSSADSLKVVAMSPPSNYVQVQVGSAVLFNGPTGRAYPEAAPAQSYMVSAPTPIMVAVPPNTSPSLVSRRLWVVGKDPQYPSSDTPVDASLEDDYTRFVWTDAMSAPPPPRIMLATVTLPPMTATVSSTMIVNDQKVLSPKSSRVVLSGPGIDERAINSSSSRNFPSFAPTVAVPSWATTAYVVATVNNLVAVNLGGSVKTTYPPPAGGTATARLRVQMGGTFRPANAGPPAGAVFGTYGHLAEDGVNIHRKTATVAGLFNVAAWRGTGQMLAIDFEGTGAVAGAPNPWFSAAAETSVVYDVWFSEE